MRFRKRAVATMAVSALAVLAGTAQASTVTVGSPLTAAFDPAGIIANGTFTNLSLSEPGANATSPVTGAVVRWSILGAEGPFVLRVLRPVGGSSYSGVGSSTVGVAPSLAKQTFNTNLPIKAGDTIGLDVFTGAKLAFAGAASGSLVAAWSPPISDGETRAYIGPDAGEIPFNAEVQPQPIVAAVTPSSAPVSGGTAVTIGGAEFTGVSAVKFGANAAASFTVNSEGQINAVAPAGTSGATDVTVTAAGGTSPLTPADRFEYLASPSSPPPTPISVPVPVPTCTVPNLSGKNLKGAKKRLGAANCKPGAVRRRKGVTVKKGKVVKQGPKAGKQLPAGSKVNLTLG